MGYGDWIGVDGSEALLVDGVLADGGRDLFLSVEADEVVLNLGINNEYWPQVMDVASLESLRENVHFGAN